MSYHHDLPVRIYYSDTDAGGVVYHSDYLDFAEKGRTEMLRDLGYPHNQMIEETGSLFVVRRIEIDYRASAVLDDLLTVRTAVKEIGKRTSVTLKQEIVRGDTVLAELTVVLVCMNSNGRATRIPEKALEIFSKAL